MEKQRFKKISSDCWKWLINDKTVTWNPNEMGLDLYKWACTDMKVNTKSIRNKLSLELSIKYWYEQIIDAWPEVSRWVSGPGMAI